MHICLQRSQTDVAIVYGRLCYYKEKTNWTNIFAKIDTAYFGGFVDFVVRCQIKPVWSGFARLITGLEGFAVGKALNHRS